MERGAKGRPKGSGRTICVGVHWESQRTEFRRTVSRFLQACMLPTYPWLFKHSFWSSARSHPEWPQSCPQLVPFPTSLSFSPGNGTVMPEGCRGEAQSGAPMALKVACPHPAVTCVSVYLPGSEPGIHFASGPCPGLFLFP